MNYTDDKLVEYTGQTVEYVKQYTDRQVTLIKLELAERSAKLISGIATTLIVGLVFLIALIFASVVLGLALGVWLGSTVGGFAIVAAIYLIAGFVVLQFKRQVLTNPILEALIDKMFD